MRNVVGCPISRPRTLRILSQGRPNVIWLRLAPIMALRMAFLYKRLCSPGARVVATARTARPAVAGVAGSIAHLRLLDRWKLELLRNRQIALKARGPGVAEH
jgi:hypothetical protein